MRVAVRVDASPAIGTGHVMRSLTLADALRARGAEVTFVTRDFARSGVNAIESRGFRAIRLPVEVGYEQTWLGASERAEFDASESALRSLGRLDWLVIDEYALGAAYERLAYGYAARILVIDDLADRAHTCDALLDVTWLPPGTSGRYEGLIPRSALHLEGPRYALLREEFGRERRRVRDDGLRRALVFFGGADPTDVTSRALDALDDDRLRDIEVDVVIGAANPHAERLIARCAGRARIHVDTRRMAQLMSAADCALGAGGTTSWERAWLGLPAIVVAIAENQREVARGLALAGAVRNAGWHEDVVPADFVRALTALRADPTALAAMSSAALAVMGEGDVLGTERVVDALVAVAGAPAPR